MPIMPRILIVLAALVQAALMSARAGTPPPDPKVRKLSDYLEKDVTGFGNKVLEELVKEHGKDLASVKTPQETDRPLMDPERTTVACPACGKSFSAPVNNEARAHRAAASKKERYGQDSDFCWHYPGAQIVTDGVWLCARCGYADACATFADARRVDDGLRAFLRKEIEPGLRERLRAFMDIRVLSNEEAMASIAAMRQRMRDKTGEERRKLESRAALLEKAAPAGLRQWSIGLITAEEEREELARLENESIPGWIKYDAALRVSLARGDPGRVTGMIALGGSHACRRLLSGPIAIPEFSPALQRIDLTLFVASRGRDEAPAVPDPFAALDRCQRLYAEWAARIPEKQRPGQPELLCLQLMIAGWADRVGDAETVKRALDEADALATYTPPDAATAQWPKLMKDAVRTRKDARAAEARMQEEAARSFREALAADPKGKMGVESADERRRAIYFTGESNRRVGEFGRAAAWLSAFRLAAQSIDDPAARNAASGLAEFILSFPEIRAAAPDAGELAFLREKLGFAALSDKAANAAPIAPPQPVEPSPKTSADLFHNAADLIARFRADQNRFPAGAEELLKFSGSGAALNYLQDPETGEDLFYRAPNSESGEKDPVPIMSAKNPKVSKCPLRLMADGRVVDRNSGKSVPRPASEKK
jgi:hypothetical protein